MDPNDRLDAAIQLRPGDSVAVSLRRLSPGETIRVAGRELNVRDAVNPGHKVALVRLAAGEAIRKYGQVIGFASEDIPAGAHVHVHNCSVKAFDRDPAVAMERPLPPPQAAPRSFRGFVRADGRVGTRNYVVLLSTVNCSASATKRLAARADRELLNSFPGVDGILPITHKGGCGLQYGGPDHEQLDRTLAGFARHPNVAGCLVIGLGCEVAQARHLIESQGKAFCRDGARPAVFIIQEEGGISKTVESGLRELREILPRAGSAKRQEVSAEHLVLGLQCGGSDAYSGMTANPALGVACDLLVAQGGTAVLAETPEIYGAEHLLTRRAASPEVAAALLERIRWWEWYAGLFGVELDNNPSPGNREGGLTTIYEKSLGAVAKGGSTALTAVYRYAEQVTAKGLVFMDTPGYDPVSLTGVVAGGASICAFTTGRGSVYGCKPAPCIKISSNTELFDRQRDDMDLDAGGILRGVPVEEVGRRIFERILLVASGEKTTSEVQGVGEEEFAPWSIGPTL